MDKKEICQRFFKNICFLRKVNGLTQKEMAAIVGISVGTLRRIEKDYSPRANCQMLCRICDYFDISADKMLICDLETES